MAETENLRLFPEGGKQLRAQVVGAGAEARPRQQSVLTAPVTMHAVPVVAVPHPLLGQMLEHQWQVGADRGLLRIAVSHSQAMVDKELPDHESLHVNMPLEEEVAL
jgi:hypothetical protein